ncbi:MAG: element excision factor XisH family protein [Nostoc sp. ChiQUE01b]|nr:element excision factor XisH family protein [Nostoc sp. ChiQUE01b]MDZ8262468.1 element excision factor XisH family protein [Nostoc sp. ChiQUE01b]
MPARDRYHENLKNALIKDAWTITDDPFHLKWGKRIFTWIWQPKSYS